MLETKGQIWPRPPPRPTPPPPPTTTPVTYQESQVAVSQDIVFAISDRSVSKPILNRVNSKNRALPGTALVLWCAGIAPVRTPHVRTVVCVAVFLVSFSLQILSNFSLIYCEVFVFCILVFFRSVQNISPFTLIALGRKYFIFL
jgi:hypothetical protein